LGHHAIQQDLVFTLAQVVVHHVIACIDFLELDAIIVMQLRS
jgi:hypothetical protein